MLGNADLPFCLPSAQHLHPLHQDVKASSTPEGTKQLDVIFKSYSQAVTL